jgi:hypothetical protein
MCFISFLSRGSILIVCQSMIVTCANWGILNVQYDASTLMFSTNHVDALQICNALNSFSRKAIALLICC